MIELDRQNILDADFVEILSLLLSNIGYDVDLFFNLLLESESVQMLSFLMLLFKTSNLHRRFTNYLPDGEFGAWSSRFAAKIEKNRHHLHFNPSALLRAIELSHC